MDRIAWYRYQLPQPGALITSAENSWPPPLHFHTAPKIPQSNVFTLFIHVPVCVCERERERVCVCERDRECVCVRERERESVCVCVCVWEREREWKSQCVCLFVYVIECVCKDETCWYIVNMFCWGIFRTVWKGKGSGQELSAEVITEPGWGSR